MYEDPESEPTEQANKPADRAREHADRFRMHAELAAVFEAPRKFDAQIEPHLDAEMARDIQRTIGKLEKSRDADSPLIPEPSVADAKRILIFPQAHSLSTSDYHIHRRPGEVMIMRWLSGDEVGTFYERLQAHFDAALNAFRDDERTSKEWKQDGETGDYLDALSKIEVKMAERYLRTIIEQHRVFLLTTQTADEMNINYLTETVMGVPAADVVGKSRRRKLMRWVRFATPIWRGFSNCFRCGESSRRYRGCVFSRFCRRQMRDRIFEEPTAFGGCGFG